MFKKTFQPKPGENKMRNVGNVEKAREDYLKHRPNNLFFLLSRRFRWMREYLKNRDRVVEIGCGAGFSRDFLCQNNSCELILTDCDEHSWIDQKVNALNMPFAENSVDAVIANNVIHHIANPMKLLKEICRILKPNGFLIIQEINCSFFMRLVLRAMRHEGYSFQADVFNEEIILSNPNDPWSANCAIPNLLFDDKEKFCSKAPFFKIRQSSFSEFFIFILSGGVVAKVKTIQLPFFVLHFLAFIDFVLIKMFPKIFALQRSIVLQKNGFNF